MVNTMHSEANTCIHRHEGMCMKCWESCPSTVRYNDNNDNNVPCNMVSYDSGRSTRNKETANGEN